MASVFISSFVKGVIDWLSLIRRTPTSSSTATTVADDLERLERTLKRVEAVLQDAEEREIVDKSVKLWLKEIKDVAYDAQDLLDDYQYEVLRARVENRDMAAAEAAAAAQASRKRKCVDGEEEVTTPLSLSSSSASNIWDASKISILSSMAGRIKKIRERLDEISHDRDRLHLKSEDGQRRRDSSYEYPPPTSHMIMEQEIYGREDDRRKLVEWLFSNKESKYEVVAVVGKGGLGKTTLAQLVYNDPKVEDYFQQRMWICVSDDFNLIRLTREMVQSIDKPLDNKKSSSSSGTLPDQLSPLQESLQKELRGKRVMLVLDDVWNDKKSLWETLRLPFGSAEMIRIIVTTRDISVAKVMQTTDLHLLGYLPQEQCLHLFMRLVFLGRDPKRFPSLVDIGEKIVEKCGGLPLAVKSLGGLLQHESDEDRWNEVLHSELWDEETDVLPALKLSYIRMPIHLKPCFQICSIFPKDYEFRKDELVKLWAAHGYIQHDGEKNTMEEIGYKYFNELHRRSFFDESHELVHGERRFEMHDIIHDLARYVLEERDLMKKGEHKIRHLLCAKHVSMEFHLIDGNNEALRTLIVWPVINKPIIDHMLGTNTKRRLTHLRYLDITLESADHEFLLPEVCNTALEPKYGRGRMARLPNLIGALYNLVVLKITCDGLVELPDTFRNLVSLTTIYFSGFHNDQLPALGQLPSLTSLTLKDFFFVESIGNLLCGGGNNRNHVAFPSLSSVLLWDLPSAMNWDQLQQGDFPRLQKLQIKECEQLSSHMILKDCGSRRLSSAECSFPPNLKTLEHFGSAELCLPQIFGELKKLERVRGIFWVTTDELFGVLKKMVRLKYLILSTVDGGRGSGLRCVTDELFHDQEDVLHLVIERDRHEGNHHHSESESDSDSEDAGFSQLKKLLPEALMNLVSLTSIYFCRFPIEQLPALGQLPSLESLTLLDLHMVESIGNEFCRGGSNRHCVAFPSLTSLVFEELTNWERWDELPEGDFPQLQKLKIKECNQLSSLPSLGNLGLLRHITLRECHSLQLSPEFSFPPNLGTLENSNFRKLKLCLPQAFGEMKKLERLHGTFGVRNGEAVFGILKNLGIPKHLFISGLWNARDASCNGEARLREYGGIKDLVLSWGPSRELDNLPPPGIRVREFLHLVVGSDEDVYGTNENSPSFWFPPHNSRAVKESLFVHETLQPHTNLEELYINCYFCVGYPRWIDDPSYDRLHKVLLRGCMVDQLPTLGQLPSLERLGLYRIYRLERIGDEFCRGINDISHSHSPHTAAFPSLIDLKFKDMADWEQWDDGVRQGDFPKLESLSIHGCPKLSQVPVLRNLGMNLKLSIYECPAIHHSAEASFPRNMKALLYYDNVEPRTYVSPGAELQNLESLKGVFRARNDELFEILNNLPMKTDTMTIAALRNVRSSSVMAAEANLKSKQGLRTLTLKWSSDINRSFGLCLVVDDNDDEGRTDQTENASFIVLEKLQPHISLKELHIIGYDGLGYPSWIGHPSFNRLVRISLSSCSNDQLPTLGQLPSLQDLKINSISGLKRIGHEFCRDTTMVNDDDVAFPSLSKLSFEAMHDWEEWCEVLDGDFPRLRKLTIKECSRLRRDLISLPQRLLNLIRYD